jgi:hypothetical protein
MNEKKIDYSIYKRPAIEKKPEDAMPVGTIISSILDFEEFSRVRGDELTNYSTKLFKWVPADGRKISGSQLSYIIQRDDAPDLRGRFLRGLNLFHNSGEGDFKLEEANPDDSHRTWHENHGAGYWRQGDVFARHTHSYHSRFLEADDGDGFSGQGFASNSKHLGETDFISSASGDNETRPKNVSVYFYIKINI